MASSRQADAVADNRPDRRQAILLAAEKLFAQHGYHAVSIRQIADEAGVPLALVGYYFGPKHDLFHAIFAHWNDTIQARLDGLAAARAGSSRNRLRAIIDAFIGPVLRLRASPEGEYYALLVARELRHSGPEADRVLREFFDPLAHAFIDALHALAPQVSRGQAAWCYQFALGALLHHLSDGRMPRLSRGENTDGDPAAAAGLAQFIEGGVRAMLIPATRSRRSLPAAAARKTSTTPATRRHP